MQKLEDVTIVVIKYKANDSVGVGRILINTICIFMTLHSVIPHRFHTGSGALPAFYPFGTGSDAAGKRR